MPAPLSAIARSGVWLQRKRNFYIFWLTTIGLPLWAWEVWFLRSFSTSVAWILFLGVLSFGGALASGFVMWRFFASKYPALREREGAKDDAT